MDDSALTISHMASCAAYMDLASSNDSSASCLDPSIEWQESKSVEAATRLQEGDPCIADRSCSAWEYIPDWSSGTGLTSAVRSTLCCRWLLAIDISGEAISNLIQTLVGLVSTSFGFALTLVPGAIELESN